MRIAFKGNAEKFIRSCGNKIYAQTTTQMHGLSLATQFQTSAIAIFFQIIKQVTIKSPSNCMNFQFYSKFQIFSYFVFVLKISINVSAAPMLCVDL